MEGFMGFQQFRADEDKICVVGLGYVGLPEKISEAKVTIITVPTPIDEHNIPDLRPIKSATKTVSSGEWGVSS